MAISDLTPTPVMVRFPVAGLQSFETQLHWMRRRPALVAIGPCNVVPNRLFTIHVANWAKAGITISKSMIVAHCTATSETLEPTSHITDSLNMTQLYKEEQARKHKHARHSVDAKEDATTQVKR